MSRSATKVYHSASVGAAAPIPAVRWRYGWRERVIGACWGVQCWLCSGLSSSGACKFGGSAICSDVRSWRWKRGACFGIFLFSGALCMWERASRWIRGGKLYDSSILPLMHACLDFEPEPLQIPFLLRDHSDRSNDTSSNGQRPGLLRLGCIMPRTSLKLAYLDCCFVLTPRSVPHASYNTRPASTPLKTLVLSRATSDNKRPARKHYGYFRVPGNESGNAKSF